MCILKMFIDDKIGSDTKGTISYDEEGVLYTFGKGNSVLLRCGQLDFGSLRRDQFEVFLVKARDCLEKQNRLLIMDNHRIGWVFPITALSTRKEIPDEKWTKIYANFALAALIFEPLIYNQVVLPELENGEFALTDFYSEESAVVILGKEAVNKIGLSIECIKVALLKYGYLPYKPLINLNAIISMSKADELEMDSIKINSFSGELSPHLQRIDSIISRGIIEGNSCTCFLTLYQLIETMLTIIFETALTTYSNDPRFLTDPWLLRDMLSKVANEKWRLNALFNNFAKPSLNHSILTDVKSVSNSFLIKYQFVKEPLESPAKALYQVRNTVVHRQIELTEEAHTDLKNINENFLELCYELISKFDSLHGKEKLIEIIGSSFENAM